MTQVQMSASFDEGIQSTLQNKKMLFLDETLADASVASITHKQHFPVHAIPIESGNWWLDETAALTRHTNPLLSHEVVAPAGEYIEHIVLPTDTLQGICLAYKVSAMRLKKENGFSGNNLQLAPKKLRIPLDTNYRMNLQRRDDVPSDTSRNLENEKSILSTTTDSENTESVTRAPMGNSLLNQFSDDKSHYSADDMLILQDIMQKLKDEMNRSDNLDVEKKKELEQVMKRLESTISRDEMWTTSMTEATNFNGSICKNASSKDATNDTYESLRKPLVAAAGGTLVATGAILVPVPIIPGVLVIYAGLSVLATEFEVASQALEKLREPLQEILAHEEDAVEQRGINRFDENAILWTDLIPITYSSNQYLHGNDIDQEFISMMQSTADRSNIDEFNEAARKTKNEMKRWARNLLNLESIESVVESTNNESMQPSDGKRSLLMRFDSLLSSYGEEVGEDGVASSDRGL
jgi:hypothetical protein